ncbi:PaaI family thioesterase [Paenibacillus hamazuiensis]|uniref:PaaI family thioesterase n=1 Tax=Paenibacillus hamazuiensis TaxID=2936508 RepID=UPI00200BA8AC|nr:PaaI family thioesterase [Paenibacillus hamazuiensis]
MEHERLWDDRLREFKTKYDEVPYWKHLGVKVESISSNETVVSLDVDPAIHTNYHATVHGGVYASILDNVMGLSIKPFDTDPVVTTQMSVHFLSAASEGTIRAYGKVIHRTGRTFTTQAEVRHEDGTLLAYATASFLKIKPKKE